MENLPTTREELMNSFSKSLPHISQGNEISTYNGNIISNEAIVRYSVKIRHAFPALPPEYYNVLLEMVKEEGFTDGRFRDAVHHVIKTCIYPTPTIAQFISFDRRIKIYTYSEYCKLCDQGDGKNYQPVALAGNIKPVWAHINDINQYNLKIWKK